PPALGALRDVDAGARTGHGHNDAARVAHDDPAITQGEKCRYDACAVVREDFQPDRSVNVASVPGGRYAVSPFRGTARDIPAAWAAWLPASGYQPDDRPCLEVYRGRTSAEKTGIFSCDLCLPVRAL